MKKPLLIFDLDDCLIDTSGALMPTLVRQAVQEMIKAGLKVSSFDSAVKKLTEINNNSENGTEAIKSFLNFMGAEEKFLEAGREGFYNFNFEYTIRPLPGVLEMLEVADNEKIIVTKGEFKAQVTKLEKSGIDRNKFKKIIAVNSYNKGANYKKILQEFKYSPEECFVCGDRFRTDLLPAKILGMKTIHIPWGRGKVNLPSPGEVDFSIKDFREIIPIIQCSPELSVAIKAVKKAGFFIKNRIKDCIEFKVKEDKTIVSDIDRRSEFMIKDTLKEKFPSYAFYGEESGEEGNSRFTWHVDPLDGTSNFKNKFPLVAVSIGLEDAGKFILGVIYNPFTDELFHAEVGKGAFCNFKPIRVSSNSKVLVIDSSFREREALEKLKLIDEFYKEFKIRMIGSNALQLAYLSKGYFCLSFSDSIHSYDIAAGLVIVKEAGGVVTDLSEKEPSKFSKVLFAANNQETLKKAIDFSKKNQK